MVIHGTVSQNHGRFGFGTGKESMKMGTRQTELKKMMCSQNFSGEANLEKNCYQRIISFLNSANTESVEVF